MGMKKKILHVVLSFLSIFFCFFPKKKNRVTFISLTNDTLKGNFKLLYDGLKKYETIDLYTILTKYEKNRKGNFLYFMNCIKQLFVINTSKVVILNDNNYVVSNFKTEFPTVIQIWHACGAIKKFGNEVEREYRINNYDYVLVTSDAWKSIYAKSFNVAQDHILPLGIPCTDVLLDATKMQQKKQELYRKYPLLKNKYVILYAPTFRGNLIKGMHHIPISLDDVIAQLPEDTVILYKLHPLLEDVYLGQHERIMNVKNEDLYSLLAVSDCLISDYSSILFDYLLVEKKQIYYIPDIQEYNANIGINLDFKDLPGDICISEDALVDCLKKRDSASIKKIKKVQSLYFTYTDGKSTERAVRFVAQLIKEGGHEGF